MTRWKVTEVVHTFGIRDSKETKYSTTITIEARKPRGGTNDRLTHPRVGDFLDSRKATR